MRGAAHSWERMRRVKVRHPPEHKAYMPLAVAIGEAIKAFIALLFPRWPEPAERREKMCENT
jgi:hypothetical protein